MEILIPNLVIVIPSVTASIIGLIIAGLAEKRYISRGTVVLNIFLLWQILANKPSLDQAIIFYINLSILFFIFSFYSFLSWTIPNLNYKKLRPIIHDLNYLFYSSKTILGVIVSTLLGYGTIGILIISTILWVLAKNYLGHEYPFKNIL